MNEEKIKTLQRERNAISHRNKELKLSQKWHRAKAEELLKEATEHLQKVKIVDEEMSENNRKYFDKGTELETLTGIKRIENLR